MDAGKAWDGVQTFHTGKSVHNQRIERLWLDMKHSVTVHFSNLFRELESDGILNVECEMHLLALHYVFIPKINHSLSNFQRTWNNHPLRTEKNQTPLQLWTEGFYKSLESGILEATAVETEDEDDTIDPSDVETNNNVVVPNIQFEIQEEHQQYLIDNFNPLNDEYEDNGKTMFRNVLLYLESLEV